jgi:hypothetical protein
MIMERKKDEGGMRNGCIDRNLEKEKREYGKHERRMRKG